MLQQGWWIIAFTTLTAFSIALVLSYRATPVYKTSARFIVSPNLAGTNSSDLLYSLDVLSRRSTVATYVEVLQSNRLYEATLQDLEVDASKLSGYKVSAVAIPDANVLELTATGPNPQMTALLVNSMSQQAITFIANLYSSYDLVLLDSAPVPSAPISPNPQRDAAVALVMGVIGGAALAILREQLRLPLEALLNQNKVDSESLAYTRSYFERLMRDELAVDTSTFALGLIYLEGLHDMEGALPKPIEQKVLRQVTRTLQRQLRGSDVFGRWDDTSFAVLLPETNGIAATRTLERIGKVLAAPVEVDTGGESFLLKPRVGVADCEKKGSLQELIQRASSSINQVNQSPSNGKSPVQPAKDR